MEVYIDSFKATDRFGLWGEPLYQNNPLLMGENWEFTKRLKYIIRSDTNGIERTELYAEIQDLHPIKVNNPNYCKYYGDQRKYIDSCKKSWISHYKFCYRFKRAEVEEIYECA